MKYNYAQVFGNSFGKFSGIFKITKNASRSAQDGLYKQENVPVASLTTKSEYYLGLIL